MIGWLAALVLRFAPKTRTCGECEHIGTFVCYSPGIGELWKKNRFCCNLGARSRVACMQSGCKRWSALPPTPPAPPPKMREGCEDHSKLGKPETRCRQPQGRERRGSMYSVGVGCRM